MLKGIVTCKKCFFSYICNLNFFVNFQCKFLSILEYGFVLGIFVGFRKKTGMIKRSYSERDGTFI